ncbi:MAG: restriction endonuclease subunit S [Clostridia bacterium]|nr:restriction endonuclease subunit S [Clostridia bacterium]
MRTPYYQKTIVATASGSTVKHTSPLRICDVKIELPPLDEQKKISSILRSIDDKIENNQKINDNLQQQAQALYQSWFVDYTPFGGIMPDAWHMGTLSDLADTIICGKTPSTKRSDYYGNEVPFITIPDMHNQIYAISTERSLSTVGASSQSGKTLPRNSICVSCIGTAGLVCLVAEPSQTNQQINSIVPSPTASPYYIYLLATTLSDKIQNLGSGGSTICNLNKGQFSAIEALVPSEKSMQEFDEIVNPLFESIHINQIEKLRLVELRDTLLPNLMSGEIDIEDIQI